ncbi:ribosomal protection-like ABC-F family protein [Carnobacterium mobile]|uniref:ribosomal protection-like ABC-F family protein n=1 Tax=Carnobacterium mobile TaxID=2750 RepID=UPI000555CB67|nr:ABC-F type ribosomal protection protein [Carnobacterium mobile]
MIVFSMQQVTQQYGAQTIFEKMSLEIQEKTRIGLIGRNGEGKTTLLKLIANSEQPSEGRISWRKGLTVGLLEQSPQLTEEKEVYAALYDSFEELKQMKKRMNQLEISMAGPQNDLEKLLEQYGKLQAQFERQGGYEIDAKIHQVATGLQIVSLLDKSWQQLSGGERTKVGLAKILLEKPDLLLLDEPTNHLDFSAIDWLTAFIRDYAGTVLIVSHDRYFLDDVTTETYEIDQGELYTYSGNYSYFIKEKEERLLNEFQQYQDQQKKIKKMKETIKRLKEWANQANPPNAGLHRRAKSMEKALKRIEMLKKPTMNQKKMSLQLDATERTGKNVFKLEQVGKIYGDRILFEELDLHIRYQDRVAIVGSNGTGKSTLLKLLLEQIEPDAGEVQVGTNLSIGYLSQHTVEMNQKFTVIEEFRDKINVTEGQARHLLAKFLFYGEDVFKPVNRLSGGEKLRLRWAQMVHLEHNVLILDEPTNHLDIDSKEVLEEALSQFEGTIIAVSHDRYFLDHYFQTTYVLKEGMLTRFEGNYTFAKKKQLSIQ